MILVCGFLHAAVAQFKLAEMYFSGFNTAPKDPVQVLHYCTLSVQ